MKNRKLLPIIAMSAMLFNFSPAFADEVTFEGDTSGSVSSDASLTLGSGDIENPNENKNNSENTKVLIGSDNGNGGVNDNSFSNLFKFGTGTIKIKKLWDFTTKDYKYTIEEANQKNVNFILRNDSEHKQTVKLTFTPNSRLDIQLGKKFCDVSSAEDSFIDLNEGTGTKIFNPDTSSDNNDAVCTTVTLGSKEKKELKATINFNYLDVTSLLNGNGNNTDTPTNTPINLFTVTCTLVTPTTISNP